MNPEENLSHMHFLSEEEIAKSRFSLKISMLLSLIILGVELYGAYLSNSLALLSDAFHILTDLTAHIVSLSAIFLALKQRTHRFNFGFIRFEILAAFFNSILLIIMCIFLIKESVHRLLDPSEIEAHHMLHFSLVGLFMNSISAYILFKVSKTSINLKSTYIHVLGDLLGTVAVVVGALIIQFTGFFWMDSILSFFIVIIIARATFYLLKETGISLLEASPDSHKLEHILEDIQSNISNVKVLDYKHWNLTAGVECINLKILIHDKTIWETKITELHKLLKIEYGITYVNIEPVSKETQPVLESISVNREKIQMHAHGHHHHGHGHHH
ncbi:MAG: cation transporter [Leptospira sp.]|nr:cation transporter [Leptospira sp.]